MKIVGIICEYNPFHLGHMRQIQMVRDKYGTDTAIICVMSGNYVQRGMPAMWDKFTRAKAAVGCGIDLVLELPITKVLQSAEGFARGGVELLSKLGCVEVLSFGAECGSADNLMALAKKFDEPEHEIAFQSYLAEGLPYAAAKQLAIGDTQQLLSHPNNILGVEYCRAILHYNSNLQPFAVQRSGSYHATQPDVDEPSATFVRSVFPDGQWKKYVPSQAHSFMEKAPWYDSKYGERAVLARLRALSDMQWEQCAHGSEGLWSKAMKESRTQHTLENLIDAIKSKRYPRTRIQRLLLCAYLGISCEDLNSSITYARILAFSQVGRKLIRKIKEIGELPLINPGETPDDQYYYRLETRASDLFTLFCASESFPCQMEQSSRLSID